MSASDYLIDRNARKLTVDGAEVSLGARAFDVLAHLHAHSDRVVSKAELLEQVWGGLAVEEGNLTVQISALRKALGPKSIATVPGVGYKLATGALLLPPGDGPTLPEKPSLAVLPFTNLTGRDEQAYLVDGIVTEIITALSRISAFFVVSSTSSFTLKGKTVDLSEVGRTLGVRYILEGSIQQAGDRLRIFTQLVEAESAHTIWQDRFDGTVDEIFELQDRIAEHVAGALEPKLIWAEAARARAKPTSSLTAYDLCLRAAPLVSRQDTLSNVEEGLSLLDRALELDPDYTQAKAYYCLAHTGAVATRWWTFEQARAAIPVARDVLNTAGDDALSLAYAGHYLAYVANLIEEGLTALKRAQALNPNSAQIGMLLGWAHNYRGDAEEAITILERAKRLSPLHPQIGVFTCGIGNALMQMGRFDEAVGVLEQALSEYPEFATTQMSLMASYWKVGRTDDSARIAELYRAKAPNFSTSYFRKHRPYEKKTYSDAVIGALRANGFGD